MGTIENEARIVRKRINIQKLLLNTIASAGILSVALVAPNALQALAVLDGGRLRRQNPKYLIGDAFQKLLARGSITIVKKNDRKSVMLTESGKQKLNKMIFGEQDMRKHRKWDGRWRVVIYDIQEKRNSTRARLRKAIQAFGFQKLQNSVWVYPYECEELIVLLKANCKIGKDVLYMVVEKIENDQQLKKLFGLPVSQD